MPARDPREIITPDAFTVAQELLGLPLATPWRRGAALAIDGLVIAILSGIGSLLLGIVAVIVLFRASTPSKEIGVLRRSVRFTLRAAAAIILFTLIVDYAGVLIEGPSSEPARSPIAVDVDDPDIELSGWEAVGVGTDLLRIHGAGSPADARAVALRFGDRLARTGLTDEQLRDFVDDALTNAPSEVREAARAVAESTRVALATAGVGADADSNAIAATAGVSGAADAAGAGIAAGSRTASEDDAGSTPPTAESPIADSQAASVVASLAERVTRLERANDRLEREADELREASENGSGSILSLLGYFTEELGVGMGWAGLYLTAFLALWRGQTPGKRLLGLRVLRLDGKPIGWWLAFERFGGYAAGIATGLLGFAQIFWDRNRQGVHDKIAETVVVRERRGRRERVTDTEQAARPVASGLGSPGEPGSTPGADTVGR